MSEKSDKLRASLEKEKERRIKINNRIESLERRIQEAEAAEVNEMVRTAKVTPEQLAALLRQSATATPNPAALSKKCFSHTGIAIQKQVFKFIVEVLHKALRSIVGPSGCFQCRQSRGFVFYCSRIIVK